MRPEDYSEDDAPIRRQRNRARTKDRPSHKGAVPGLVVGIDRGRFHVRTDSALLTCVKSREIPKGAVVVGDRVLVSGDTSGKPDSLARVVEVTPRRNSLRRTADDTDLSERVIVANVDLLGIVTATADPEPNYAFIDRALIAAYDAGIRPLLIVTKSDLNSQTHLADHYSALQVDTIACGRDDALAPLEAILAQQISVLVGQSGVGKSTLVNRLCPDADRETGSVNTVTGQGRHTSTSVRALALPAGGYIVDTPGIRSFGLGHVTLDSILQAYPVIAAAETACPRGCSHQYGPCRLDETLADDPEALATLGNLRRILAAVSEDPY